LPDGLNLLIFARHKGDMNMVFIGKLKFEKKQGFLDTEEKVREAREILVKSTEDTFRKLDNAKMASWEGAHSILLD
jgi:hypothetical protein